MIRRDVIFHLYSLLHCEYCVSVTVFLSMRRCVLFLLPNWVSFLVYSVYLSGVPLLFLVRLIYL